LIKQPLLELLLPIDLLASLVPAFPVSALPYIAYCCLLKMEVVGSSGNVHFNKSMWLEIPDYQGLIFLLVWNPNNTMILNLKSI
jgi:hypothetical protein